MDSVEEDKPCGSALSQRTACWLWTRCMMFVDGLWAMGFVGSGSGWLGKELE
jgi:hypothetical protein